MSHLELRLLKCRLHRPVALKTRAGQSICLPRVPLQYAMFNISRVFDTTHDKVIINALLLELLA